MFKCSQLSTCIPKAGDLVFYWNINIYPTVFLEFYGRLEYGFSQGYDDNIDGITDNDHICERPLLGGGKGAQPDVSDNIW